MPRKVKRQVRKQVRKRTRRTSRLRPWIRKARRMKGGGYVFGFSNILNKLRDGARLHA